MRDLLMVMMSMLLLISCKQNSGTNDLEAAVEKAPTPENISALFSSYTDEIRSELANEKLMTERLSRIVDLSCNNDMHQQGLKAISPLSMLNPALEEPRNGMKYIFKDFGEQAGLDYLDAMSDRMFNDSLFRLDPPIANRYVLSCEAFADAYDGAASTVEILHKAAETSRTLQNIDKALDLYDRLIEKHPEHPRGQQALFSERIYIR